MMHTIQRLHKKKGFTIVELVVVMAIIGVLAAILVPVLLGVTVKANVGSANSTAAEIKKQIGYFLTMTDADHKNYMLMSDGCREAFTFTVNDGNWHIDAVQNPAAFSPDTVTWGNAADVDESTTTTTSQYGEELLGMYLKNCFPELKNGVIRANCIKGVCVSAWYTPDTVNKADINDVPTFGTSNAWVDDSGNEIASYPWNGATAGVSADGYVIGTAPTLELGA